MSLESKLKQLCDNVDGSIASFFCSYDGILIGSDIARKNVVDVDFLAANFSSVINGINKNYEVSDVIFTLKESILIIKTFPEGFVGIVLSKDGNLGRCKLELNKVGDLLGS